MPWFSADLHIHSCLSPCGSLEMSPKAIAQVAKTRGLDLIALTDHNSTRNCPAFAENCRREGLSCLFGAEVTCAEEAHCLCLFGDLNVAVEFGDLLFARLIKVPNNPEAWGDQVVVNADEEIEDEVLAFLISATNMGLEELGRIVHDLGGLFIPAHVERTAFSLMSQLGFVPPGDYDALEIYHAQTNHHTVRLKPHLSAEGVALPALIQNSDAHFVDDVGKRRFLFRSDKVKPDFESLKIALQQGWITLT